jgi:hypothetical protein
MKNQGEDWMIQHNQGSSSSESHIPCGYHRPQRPLVMEPSLEAPQTRGQMWRPKPEPLLPSWLQEYREHFQLDHGKVWAVDLQTSRSQHVTALELEDGFVWFPCSEPLSPQIYLGLSPCLHSHLPVQVLTVGICPPFGQKLF